MVLFYWVIRLIKWYKFVLKYRLKHFKILFYLPNLTCIGNLNKGTKCTLYYLIYTLWISTLISRYKLTANVDKDIYYDAAVAYVHRINSEYKFDVACLIFDYTLKLLLIGLLLIYYFYNNI